MCRLPRDSDKLFEIIKNTESYNKTFCVSIDLLGIKSLIDRPNTNLNIRLYNLYSSFQAADTVYPLSGDIRVCYIGDSIWLIKEFSVNEEEQINLETEGKAFYGQIYLISSDISILEKFGENSSEKEPCGIRVILSYGKTYEIHKNELWAHKKNWYVFTGPNTALNKCFKAENIGENSGYGFLKNYCYAEIWNQNRRYLGYRLKCQPVIEEHNLKEKYIQIYEQIFSSYFLRPKSQVSLGLGTELTSQSCALRKETGRRMHAKSL